MTNNFYSVRYHIREYRSGRNMARLLRDHGVFINPEMLATAKFHLEIASPMFREGFMSVARWYIKNSDHYVLANDANAAYQAFKAQALARVPRELHHCIPSFNSFMAFSPLELDRIIRILIA